jgi:hypothetical protein
MSLIRLFEIVEEKSYQLRKTNPQADGQQFWQPIKEELSKFDIEATGWKNIKKEYQKTLFRAEFYIDGYGNKNIIEINHFIIQTIRIPLNEKPTLRKIIQIALNIGQYTGSGFPKEPWMNLENYLTKENIKKIDKQISKQLLNEIMDM